MNKFISILTIGLIILCSCESKESQYFHDESKVVNEKITYNLSKIQKKYAMNPQMAKPYFEFSSFLETKFDSILYFVDQENSKEVYNRFINLYSYIEPSSYFDSKYIQQIVIPNWFNKWIGNEKKYDFSDNKEILKLDVLNLENELLNYLYNSIEADYFKFNQIQAMIVDSSNNIKVGETYHANIFLAAFDTTKYPLIMVADSSQPDSVLLMGRPDNKRLFEIEVINGKGIYKKKVHKAGIHGFKGVYCYPAPNGDLLRLTFYQEFNVTNK
ncbi:hypothetical protein [Sunxiuqinia elliptica]|uniref:Gliding motility-associated protein GldM first immunoglobulin-like domain-containing protein n=1 Tax=Sunxiuqinia elliptica TaxID=655355 RepID=A0A1I2MF37_9BACT|nr:hypothetical protein [Sunxiuqinia elliptica]SFF90082.1 hypothetical protein SAMN05216283_12033 [Sunxiuqinia elliptica]